MFLFVLKRKRRWQHVENWRRHDKKVHQKEFYKCKECDYKSGSSRKTLMHEKICHSNRKCEICSIVLSSVRGYRRHMKTHQRNRGY
jgi:hypothetical protein